MYVLINRCDAEEVTRADAMKASGAYSAILAQSNKRSLVIFKFKII